MTSEGKDDTSIMYPPEISVTVNGEKIVLREYSWVEELELRRYSQAFITDLVALIGGSDLTIAAIESLVSKHIQAVQQLIAASADRTVEWVRKLSKEDGRAVYSAWWAANGPFIVSCATECVRSDLVKKALDGLTFAQP